MRIRTIKPEFWQSETMASIPKDSRLLAIAVLNYADDQGYFYDVPRVIRGALFPFDDDSTTIRRGLDDLSQCGYIRIGTAPDGKRVCHIVHFRDHQKIDKPQPSKIAASGVDWDQFDDCSPTIPRTLDDCSPTEGNGNGMEKEGNGSIRGSKSQRVKPPTEDEWVAYCSNSWADWHPECIREGFSYYESVGWRTKAGPIKDWKAAARTAHGNASQWGKLQPRAGQITPPTFDEWISEANQLVKNRVKPSAEWPYAGAEAEFQKNQANGWRFVQDWKSACAAAHSRFMAIEDAAQNRRMR